MEYLSTEGIIGGFLLFATLNAIFVVPLVIFKICRALCVGSKSSSESPNTSKVERIDNNDENRCIEQRNSAQNEDGEIEELNQDDIEQKQTDNKSSPIANIDEWNNKIEQLQTKLSNLETKIDAKDKDRRSKSDDIKQYLPYINQDHFEKKEDDEIKPLLLKRHKSAHHTMIKRRYILYCIIICARIIMLCVESFMCTNNYVRFSGIAEYYKKYRNCSPYQSPERKAQSISEEAEESKSGSVSPMSTIYYPNRTDLPIAPTSYLYEECDDDLKLNTTPPRKVRHRHHIKDLSSKTTMYENIMMSTTVLDGIRLGQLHDVINQLTYFLFLLKTAVYNVFIGQMHRE